MEHATVKPSDERQTATRTMSVREFLRGGYKEPGGPIIVLSGNEVALVAFPGISALVASPPTVVVRPSTNGHSNGHTVPLPGPIVPLTSSAFTPVPKPSAAKARHR